MGLVIATGELIGFCGNPEHFWIPVNNPEFFTIRNRAQRDSLQHDAASYEWILIRGAPTSNNDAILWRLD